MGKFKNQNSLLVLFCIAFLGFSSCQKDQSIATGPDAELTLAKQEAIAITMNGSVSGPTSPNDSLYVMGACHKGNKRAEIAVGSLRTEINAYLTVNYSGYTFQKAFSITNTKTNAIDSYVVVIQFNSKPVALKFDAAGAFIKVLELRERNDLGGKGGWHLGGWFEHRDGKHRDTIAVSALPAAIKLYFAVNYTQDTLVRAFVNKDLSVIVLSKNITYFATAFNANGAFLKRIQVPCHPGKGAEITIAELPANSQTFLTNTFPNYALKNAFIIKANGVVKGYMVLIDANLTKYAVQFNASGELVSAIAIR